MLNTVQKDKQDNDPDISDLEKLARQRDYKRRRQTYRAKNVHITKRSTVEVMYFSILYRNSVMFSIKNS